MNKSVFFKSAVALVCLAAVIIIVKGAIDARAVPPSAGSANISDVALPRSNLTSSSTDISAPNGIIDAMIADTPATEEKGLGDRDSLPSDSGMIFVFPQPGTYAFWMKDMRFPLDMVWIGADKHVLGVTSDISADTYPNVFLPPSAISYVLELNAGAADRFGIATGTMLTFSLVR